MFSLFAKMPVKGLHLGLHCLPKDLSRGFRSSKGFSGILIAQHFAGFPRALEIMENLENQEKKFHAWKNHGI